MSRRHPPQTFMPLHDPYITAKQNCRAACNTYNQVFDHVSTPERIRLLSCILRPPDCDITDKTVPSASSNKAVENTRRMYAHMPEIQPPLHVQYGLNVQIDSSTTVGRNLMIFDSPVVPVRIGARCRIGPNTAIYTDTSLIRNRQSGSLTVGEELVAAVTVDEDCWIGGGVTICAGVHVGRGSTIEDGSVVMQDVLPGQFVSGNPAASTLSPSLDSDPPGKKAAEKSSNRDRDIVQLLQLLTAFFKCMTSFMKLRGEKGL